VVTIVSSDRAGEGAKRKWQLGVKIHQMSDPDRELLASYLEKRGADEPIAILE
jgi:hypothetical protein